jgi:hypothetical protein
MKPSNSGKSGEGGSLQYDFCDRTARWARSRAHMGCYHAHLAKIDDVAKVVKNIEPYIGTENKKEQIQQFRPAQRAKKDSTKWN